MKEEEPTLRKETRPNYLDGVKCYIELQPEKTSSSKLSQ